MAATLESMLNIAIPWGVVLIFIGLIYWKLQEPINLVFKLIGKGISKMWEGISTTSYTPTEVTYK